MKKGLSPLNVLGGPVRFIGNIINYIFGYLTCHEHETSNNPMSLRNLYNSGQIDEGKYHQFRSQSWNDGYDPEEIDKPV